MDSFFRGLVLRWFFVCAFFLLSCTAQQRTAILGDTFTTIDCGFHASLSCAGQSMARCTLPSVNGGDWGEYAACLSRGSQGCVTASLARCALAGIARVSGSLFVGGSSGCGTQEHLDLTIECVEEMNPQNEVEAVGASSECWRTTCGF